MHAVFLDLLECPACHGSLTWTITAEQAGRIEEAEAQCAGCGAQYPVREGIGLFLLPELPRNDLWEQAESRLSSHLREHADVERQLMEGPADQLAPADQLLRAMVLTDRGAFGEAHALTEAARPRLYTPEYLACYDEELKRLGEMITPASWPLVDLASGQGTLIEMLIQRFDSQPVIASDFSPTVLRRNRRRLQFFGLADRVTLLAFDARRTPFKSGSIKTMTTFLGLANIEQPGTLLHELRRIVAGLLLAIVFFLPEDDTANATAIPDATFFLRRSTLEQFAAAGWQAELTNVCTGRTLPTPPSLIFEGMRIDGMPVTETLLKWGILAAY